MTKPDSENQTNSRVFDPWPSSQVHLEWGPVGAQLAGNRGDIVVLVDVLSFSTTLTIACGRGVEILVYSPGELDAMGGWQKAARHLNAEIIEKSRSKQPGKLSLSPTSLINCSPGLRLIVTSLNGAICVAAAGKQHPCLIGSLRNESATADYITALLKRVRKTGRVTLVPCGEQWSSSIAGQSGWRPSLEDHLGAGAIAASLQQQGLTLSVEAQSAAAIWNTVKNNIEPFLLDSISGRELITKDFQSDVHLAAQVDADDCVVVESKPGSREFRAVR